MTSALEFTYPELSPWHKRRMLTYASQVLEMQQLMMTNKGKNILHYTLKRKRRHERWSHYPKGDRIDYDSGAQYFYHCHRENYDSTEHGHFHCFIRYEHIPKLIKPAPLSDWDLFIDNPMTHVVAIGMNQLGQPIRLFTVNRWVTSEIWYRAQHMPKILKRFKMNKTDDSYWQVLDKWVEGMIHLYAPQIAWLHQDRDRKIALYKQENKIDNPYIDHGLEDLSEIEIDLKQQIEWILG